MKQKENMLYRTRRIIAFIMMCIMLFTSVPANGYESLSDSFINDNSISGAVLEVPVEKQEEKQEEKEEEKEEVLSKEEQYEDFLYKRIEDKISITKYCGKKTYVEIPQMIHDLPVTSLEKGVFSESPSVDKVWIPDTISRIADGAIGYIGEQFQKKDLVIRCNPGSEAHRYAVSHQIRIEIAEAQMPGTSQITLQATSEGDEYTAAEDFDVTITEEGIVINKYCGSDSICQIPQSMYGSKVIRINDQAFYKCENLTSVSIPNSVTSIGKQAFYACKKLVSVSLPAGIQTIEEESFSQCIALKTIQIPSGVTSIGKSAFRGCEGLTKVLLPESIISLGQWSFQGCKSLQSVILPNSLQSMEDACFGACESLTNIAVPDSVREFGDGMFIGCSKLISAKLPSALTYVAWETFRDCSSLTTVSIPESVTTLGCEVFYNCKSLKNIDIPSGVKSIKDECFYNCSSLESITIPVGVTSIGSYAFYRCSALRKIKIPYTVKKIEAGTFYGCKELSYIYLCKSLNYIGKNAFYNCGLKKVDYGGNLEDWKKIEIESGNTALTSFFQKESEKTDESTPIYKYLIVNNQVSIISYHGNEANVSIPATIEGKEVVSIGEDAFCGNKSVKSIKLPAGIQTIGAWAFSSCSNLTKVYMGNKVVTLGEGVFYHCANLTEIILPESVESIGKSAFEDCIALTKARLPGSVSFIGDRAFYGCKNLAAITIPQGIDYLRNYLFAGCESLKNIKIPNGVKRIGYFIFKDCKNLTEILLPESLLVIGGNAFQNCINLSKISLPSDMTAIRESAFYGCKSLQKIVLPKGITRIDDMTFFQCSNLETITILGDLTYVGTAVFAYCERLTGMKISGGSAIHRKTFKGCSSLRWVELPRTLQKIEEEAFAGCKALNEIRVSNLNGFLKVSYSGNDSNPFLVSEKAHLSFSEGGYPSEILIYERGTGHSEVTDIPRNVFANMKDNLQSVTIASTVKKISANAFRATTGISELHISSLEDWMTILFANYNANPLYTHDLTREDAELTQIYLGQEPLEYVTIPGELTVIPSYCFRGSNIETVSMEDGIQKIESYAFADCYDLNQVTLSNNLLTIKKGTFQNCTDLESIEIPASVKKIEEGAFEGCENLTRVIWHSDPDEMDIHPNAFELDESERNDSHDYQATKIVEIDQDLSYYVKKNHTLVIHSKSGEGCIPDYEKKEDSPFYRDKLQGEAAFDKADMAQIQAIELHGISSVGSNAFGSLSNLTTVRMGQSCKIHFLADSFLPYQQEISIHYFPDSEIQEDPCKEYWEKHQDYITLNEGIAGFQWEIKGDTLILRQISDLQGDVNFMASPFLSYADRIKYVEFIHYTYNRIPDYMFKDLTNLKEIELSSSVRTIGQHAFDSCTSLTTVTYSDDPNENHDFYIGVAAFKNCRNLIAMKNVTVDYMDEEGAEISEEPFLDLPDKLSIISAEAFRGCSSVTEVVTVAKIQDVKDRAFYGCSSLERADLTDIVNKKWTGKDIFANSSYTGNGVITGDSTDDIDEYALKTKKVKKSKSNNKIKVKTKKKSKKIKKKSGSDGDGYLVNNNLLYITDRNRTSYYVTITEGKKAYLYQYIFGSSIQSLASEEIIKVNYPNTSLIELPGLVSISNSQPGLASASIVKKDGKNYLKVLAKGIARGYAVISCFDKNHKLIVNQIFCINAKKIQALKADKTKYFIYPKKSRSISFTGLYGKLISSSSNQTIALVDGKKISGLKAGNVTVTYKDQLTSSVCKVAVAVLKNPESALTVKKNSKKSFTVSWNKPSYAPAYQLQISTNKDFKTPKVINLTKTKLSYTYTNGLKKYVRMRYLYDGQYSAWSKYVYVK